MTFNYLYAMLQKYELRISFMEEQTEHQYVEYKDKKGNDRGKYEYHNLKELHVIKWNLANLSNTRFCFVILRDTTWDEVFEDMARQLRKKFGTKVAKKEDTESRRKPKTDGR